MFFDPDFFSSDFFDAGEPAPFVAGWANYQHYRIVEEKKPDLSDELIILAMMELL